MSHPLTALCRSCLGVLFLSATLSLHALEPAPPFGDGMVLQRGIEVPVWGKASPGAGVLVTFGGRRVDGKADAQGNWRVTLPPMEASAENRVLEIASGGKAVKFSGVLVGEVWVGSGQSNMAGRVSAYAKNDATLAALVEKAPYPGIRLCNGGPKPQWKEADTETVSAFSALLFAFGERLHREAGVPVGLIVGAVGGTPSGAWMPGETFASSELCRSEIATYAKTWDRAKAMKQHEAKLAAWEKSAEAAKAEGKKPPGRKPQPPVDPGGMTRGGKVGNLFDRYIRSCSGYAVRGVLWDQGEAGSGIHGLGQYTSMTELIRGWRDLWGQGDFPFLFVQKPSGLGNAFSREDPITREADAFSALPDIKNIGTGEGRLIYTRLMRDIENAWMVPAIDLGSMIHPVNKWGYGNRAAEVALEKVYGDPEVRAYGPIYRSHEIEGGRVRVRFDAATGGLAAAHADEIRGFALSGADGTWHWAEAKIEGDDTVVLSCEAVPEPKHVRYAFAKNRTWANLFNGRGLPALAFTTEEVDLPSR